VLRKDRVFKRFRSLFTQRPTYSSVLRPSLGFNAELVKYSRISGMAGRDHKLAQKGIVELIPGLSALFVITSPSTDPECLHYNCRGRNSNSLLSLLFTLFSTLF